jgi:Cu(I)/Ag(I) efflux system periplasmic protein CusF
MKSKIVVIALALVAAVSATAQVPEMTDAEVRKLDPEAKKITLRHGPIKNLDMPGMTMVFTVKDAALLDKLAAGDKVRFAVEQQQGALVLTRIDKVAK